jgi:hypothetical protein
VVWVAIFMVFAAIAAALVVLELELSGAGNPVDAEIAALDWVGDGVTQVPRHDGGHWEVDVVRPDGSLVEVNLEHDLALRNFDEEFGPAGTPAHDELTGAVRARAVTAAFAEVGPGHVVGVERESDNEIEVGIQKRRDRQVEVQLDRRFRVTAVLTEDPRDE